jgi:hypothetical protein
VGKNTLPESFRRLLLPKIAMEKLLHRLRISGDIELDYSQNSGNM